MINQNQMINHKMNQEIDPKDNKSYKDKIKSNGQSNKQYQN